MAETCCGRRAARATMESINQSLGDLGDSIRSPGSGEGGLERDPNCACDPCMCPSDDVPCNARYLGNDLSNQGLQQALNRLVRHARQIQAAQGDACNCADRPPPRAPSPIEEPEDVDVSVREPLGFFSLPSEIRNEIYALWLADLDVLTAISAVRMRLPEDNHPTRLSRNYPTNPPQRHVLREPPEEAVWRPNLAAWEREVESITYELAAADDELQRLPAERLALLRVSRAMNQEAGGLFYRQRFSFLTPREIIQADHSVYHGILALEAFLNDRTDANRLSDIEIDLRPVHHPDLVDDRYDYAGRDVTMRAVGPGPRFNWTDGLDRLPVVAERLRDMRFQHLHLHFDGHAPYWWEFRITDPRQNEDRFGNLVFPWTVPLFNIGPRNRLRLTIGFDHTITLAEYAPRRRAFIHRAVYMLRVIRHFLLRNARALDLGYQGIRVHIEYERPEMARSRSGYARVVADRTILVECDDEYIPESNEIRSRLRSYDDEEARSATRTYMATDNPPPEIEPPATDGPRRRQRARPQEESPRPEEQEQQQQQQQQQQDDDEERAWKRLRRLRLDSPPPQEEEGRADEHN